MKINFIQKKPFFIFEIENFLSNEQYEIIEQNFPIVQKRELIDADNNKFFFDNYSNTYKSQKNNRCIQLLEKIFNDDFFLELYRKVQKEIIISRKNSISTLYPFFRKVRIVKENKQKNFFEKFIYSNLKYTYQFSYMYKDGFIVPHTDSKAKILSIMLYFPKKDQENLKIGTTFYNCKIKNFNNKSEIFKENKDNFYKNVNDQLTLPFSKKNLYCFIKSDSSWHSVEKLDIPENDIRRSININLNI